MQNRWIRRCVPAALTALAVLGTGCGRSEPASTPAVLPSPVPGVPTDAAAEFFHVRFADGQLSLNDRCPVKKGHLNVDAHPLFVNGRPVGFC